MIKAARESILQAYPNAPWRSQVQVIGVFSVGLVSIAMLAGLYLYRGNQLVAGELFEIADFDAALARFEELRDPV